MSWIYHNAVHIVGPFYYWKTVLNAAGTGTEHESSSSTSLSAELRRAMLKLKGEYMSDDGSRVDYAGMEKSAGFVEYKTIAQQLAFINLAEMEENERKAFFINIYNALVIHALIYGFVRKSWWGFLISRKLLYSTAAYNIGGLIYSLDEIEHGILRGNATPVLESRPIFREGDPRLPYIVTKDPRIHFALNCGALSCPPISAYKADTLDRDLTKASRNYLQSTQFKGDGSDAEIILSKLFVWYRNDFGLTDKDVLEWVRANGPSEVADRVKAVLDGSSSIKISYQEYVWSVNSL